MFVTEHLYKFPFLRFALPLVAGIVCGDHLFSGKEGEPPLSSSSFAALLLLSFLAVCVSYSPKNFRLRWVFGVSAAVFFFILGMYGAYVRLGDVCTAFPNEEAVYRATITHKPETRERSVLCRAVISVPHPTDASIPGRPQKNVLLYFPKDSAGNELKNGDELLVRTKVSLPANNGNPDGFDYPRYLLRKGISGTGYVPAGHWKVTGGSNRFSLQSKALDCRDRIVEMYRQLGFGADELSILSALTVGYKEELSEDIREAFAVSGVSHVLAMSGLHLGIISAMLYFLLGLIPGRGRHITAVRAVVVIGVLWGFAFISGLSASIVRSAVMFSLPAVAGLLMGRVFTLNTLGVAATAMLLYNPGWLFYVGFQLSFCAVIAILLIQPRLYSKFSFTNKVYRYVWGLVTVSLAAQAGTLPFILLYFNRFPSHFLLTNLVAIPLVALIIYLAIAMLLLTPLPAVQSLLAWPEQTLLGFLVKTVKWVERLPFASIDNIWISRPEAVIYFVVLLALTGFMVNRKASYLMIFLAGCISIAGYRTYATHADRPEDGMVVYNLRNCPAIHCITSQRDSWLVYADSLDDKNLKRLNRTAGRHWSRLRLPPPTSVAGDFDGAQLTRKGDLLCFAGKKLLIINDDRWNNKKPGEAFALDYLYIGKGYTGNIRDLLHNLAFEEVILGGSLSGYHTDRLANECRILGIAHASGLYISLF